MIVESQNLLSIRRVRGGQPVWRTPFRPAIYEHLLGKVASLARHGFATLPASQDLRSEAAFPTCSVVLLCWARSRLSPRRFPLGNSRRVSRGMTR